MECGSGRRYARAVMRGGRVGTAFVWCRDTPLIEWVMARDMYCDDEWKLLVRSAFAEWLRQQGPHRAFGRFGGSSSELGFLREHIDGE